MRSTFRTSAQVLRSLSHPPLSHSGVSIPHTASIRIPYRTYGYSRGMHPNDANWLTGSLMFGGAICGVHAVLDKSKKSTAGQVMGNVVIGGATGATAGFVTSCLIIAPAPTLCLGGLAGATALTGYTIYRTGKVIVKAATTDTASMEQQSNNSLKR